MFFEPLIFNSGFHRIAVRGPTLFNDYYVEYTIILFALIYTDFNILILPGDKKKIVHFWTQFQCLIIDGVCL